MACKFCGESDPFKLMMSTRIINDEVVTIDVCFNCYYREKFIAEVIGNMGDGKALRENQYSRNKQGGIFKRYKCSFAKLGKEIS